MATLATLGLIFTALYNKDPEQPTKCVNNCSGSGKCEDGVCSCNSGFTGTYCETTSKNIQEVKPPVYSSGITSKSDYDKLQIGFTVILVVVLLIGLACLISISQPTSTRPTHIV